MLAFSVRQTVVGPAVLFLCSVVLVALLYAEALPGYWLFDDWPNLVALNEVDDLSSALSFSLSGNAGPLGRPISLATFALQASAWDEHPEVMIATNVAIHIGAMFAVFFLAAGLARLRMATDQLVNAWWIGAFVAALWALAPFLASTHLMVIQRMTSLSGLFVFAGLALFVWAHNMRSRTVARVMLVIGLGLGTVLATFSKENGALLPLLALLVLVLWIPGKARLTGKPDKILMLALVVAPSALLFAYIGSGFVETLLRGDYGARRDFSVTDRLVTQPLILWDYVRNLLLPSSLDASPFMDHVPPARGLLQPPQALIALASWAVVIATAFLVRNRAPWLLLGIAFFLVAHVLESSYIGLELYFAHRNYVPAFGLFFGLVFFAFALRPTRLPIALLGTYTLVVAAVLFQVTGSWNHKLVNGELWVEHNPKSVRAHQFLANAYTESGNFVAARRVREKVATRYPEHDLLQLQRTENCVGREKEFAELLDAVAQNFRASDTYHSNVPTDLRRAARKSSPSPLCPPRTHGVLIQLADTLLTNPTYADRDFARAQLMLVKAFSYAELGEGKRALEWFHESLRIRPDLDIAFRALSLQANLGDYDGAMKFLDEVESIGPKNAFERRSWKERIVNFREILRESREIDEVQGRGLE